MNKYIICMCFLFLVIVNGCTNNSIKQEKETGSSKDLEAIVEMLEENNLSLSDIDDMFKLSDGTYGYIKIIELNSKKKEDKYKKVLIRHKNNKETFESQLNSELEVHISDMDFNDEYDEVVITETLSNKDKISYIYSCSINEIIFHSKFSHIGTRLLYDYNGNIYFSNNHENTKVIDSLYNYKTKKSEKITDEELKNELTGLFEN